jgi:hypothetical protein
MSKTPVRKVRDGQKIPSLPANLSPLHTNQIKTPKPKGVSPLAKGK